MTVELVLETYGVNGFGLWPTGGAVPGGFPSLAMTMTRPEVGAAALAVLVRYHRADQGEGSQAVDGSGAVRRMPAPQ